MRYFTFTPFARIGDTSGNPGLGDVLVATPAKGISPFAPPKVLQMPGVAQPIVPSPPPPAAVNAQGVLVPQRAVDQLPFNRPAKVVQLPPKINFPGAQPPPPGSTAPDLGPQPPPVLAPKPPEDASAAPSLAVQLGTFALIATPFWLALFLTRHRWMT
jgi:hypothetical protein